MEDMEASNALLAGKMIINYHFADVCVDSTENVAVESSIVQNDEDSGAICYSFLIVIGEVQAGSTRGRH